MSKRTWPQRDLAPSGRAHRSSGLRSSASTACRRLRRSAKTAAKYATIGQMGEDHGRGPTGPVPAWWRHDPQRRYATAVAGEPDEKTVDHPSQGARRLTHRAMESCEDSTRAGAEADMSGDGQTVLDRLARPDAEASAKSVLDDLFWRLLPHQAEPLRSEHHDTHRHRANRALPHAGNNRRARSSRRRFLSHDHRPSTSVPPTAASALGPKLTDAIRSKSRVSDRARTRLKRSLVGFEP